MSTGGDQHTTYNQKLIVSYILKLQQEKRRGENPPARNSLMGIDSPLTGAPSMISYFATVSVSVVVLGPEKEVSD